MLWKSEGLLFCPDHEISMINSHGWVPTPFKINEDVYKVFYAGRDKFNHSNIFAFDYSMNEQKNNKNLSKTPLKKR